MPRDGRLSLKPDTRLHCRSSGAFLSDSRASIAPVGLSKASVTFLKEQLGKVALVKVVTSAVIAEIFNPFVLCRIFDGARRCVFNGLRRVFSSGVCVCVCGRGAVGGGVAHWKSLSLVGG